MVHSFQPSFQYQTPDPFSLGKSGGFLERRIPGKNENGRYKHIFSYRLMGLDWWFGFGFGLEGQVQHTSNIGLRGELQVMLTQDQ